MAKQEILNKGNGRVFVPAPPGYPGQKYIADKWAPRGRYVYRYQADEFKQTGRVADPKKEVLHHVLEPHDTQHFTREGDKNVVIESRARHYKVLHGRPFAKRDNLRTRSM